MVNVLERAMLSLSDKIGTQRDKCQVLYSEADFQFMLARELSNLGCTNVLLEHPVTVTTDSSDNGAVRRTLYVDLIAEYEGKQYPIELKYKTKSQECKDVFGHIMSLRNQSAYDISRYLFWKDVHRIESILSISDNVCESGFVIFLTNDENYYEKTKSGGYVGIDKNFLINEDCSFNGEVRWQKIEEDDKVCQDGYLYQNQKDRNGKNVAKVKYPNFLLDNKYGPLKWQIFAGMCNCRYLLLEINNWRTLKIH